MSSINTTKHLAEILACLVFCDLMTRKLRNEEKEFAGNGKEFARMKIDKWQEKLDNFTVQKLWK